MNEYIIHVANQLTDDEVRHLERMCNRAYTELERDTIFANKLTELVVQECFKAAMVEAGGKVNPYYLMQSMKQRVGI